MFDCCGFAFDLMFCLELLFVAFVWIVCLVVCVGWLVVCCLISVGLAGYCVLCCLFCGCVFGVTAI